MRAAALRGPVTAGASASPAPGTALAWLPPLQRLAPTGQVSSAVGLTIWFVAVVGTVDNVLRPRLVGGDTQMPDLLILISTLGGLSLFGVAGLIVGPVVAALFVTMWDVYEVSFRDLLGDDGGGGNGGGGGDDGGGPPGAPGPAEPTPSSPASDPAAGVQARLNPL
jgi:hypothetical protein